MSTKTEALAFLSELQQFYMQNGGISPLGFKYNYVRKPQPTESAIKKMGDDLVSRGFQENPEFWKKLNEYADSRKMDFTAEEDLFNIRILGVLIDEIKKVFELSKLPYPGTVVFGTAQFGEINAFATLPSRSSDIRVVVLDDGLLNFINSLAKIVSLMMPKRVEGFEQYSMSFDPADIVNEVKNNEQGSVQFRDLIEAYLIKGHSMFGTRFAPNKIDDAFTDILRHTAEMFIMAHELGHIFHKHLDGDPREERRVAEQLNLQTWEINHQKEYQADEFALMIVMRNNHHVEDMTAEMSFVGVSFFFTAMDILYKALEYEFSDSHPSPVQRIKNLIRSFYADTPDKELVDDIVKFSDSVSLLLYRLWDKNREQILSAIQIAKILRE